MKIFELAKELDLGALDLVEKLRSHGFTVRNHMSKLSEEEAITARKLLSPATKKTASKKKKKVVKKAKKTTKKVATTTEKKSVAEKTKVKVEGKSEGTPAKSKKKSLVIRRRATTGKEKTKEEEASQLSAEALSSDSLDAQEIHQENVLISSTEDLVSVDASEAPGEFQEDLLTKESVKANIKAKQESSEVTGGLRVVSRPVESLEATEEQVKEVEKSSEVQDPSVKKKEYLKEEMHTFTPVYIPLNNKKDEKTDKEDGGDDRPDHLKTASGDPNAPQEETSKKRMGGLASIVTKPKITSKSRELTQLRADEELKSFSMGLVGKTLYSSIKKKKVYVGPTKKTELTKSKEAKRVIQIPGYITAKDLSQKLSVKFNELANKALDLDLLIKEDDYLGILLASDLATLFDYRVQDESFNEDKILNKEADKDKEKSSEKLKLRDPVVTVMGHVDHGKTTLLDFIRSSKVVDKEAGGITQHIAAYQVKTESDQLITFIDTPGHAAFGSMRQRGAKLTDIVILVVAADDGVMPQTKESIRFCQDADVPIIVAVNKMDKEGANSEKVKQELMEFNLTPEEWGGDTQYVEVSALKGQGIDKLLEAVHLQAEIMELTSTPKGKAHGVVIESRIEKGRGVVTTALVQKGTLKQGENLVVGESFGRVRSLLDFSGKALKSAGPSTPILLVGLNTAPGPGDEFHVVKNEREAKKVVENRLAERKELDGISSEKMSLEDFFSSSEADESGQKVLKLIIRADVLGSFEAIKSSLESMGNAEVKVEIIGGGAGPITDSDVELAHSAKGYVIGFNMRPTTSAQRLSERKGLDVKTYSIIYELIDNVKLALEGLLEPEFSEKYVGRAEVKETFQIPKVGIIAGSGVIDGSIQKGCHIRLLRDGKVVYDGKLSSLKRFKDDVKEVKFGHDCGISLDKFNDIKVKDIFEAYILEEKKRKLDENMEIQS